MKKKYIIRMSIAILLLCVGMIFALAETTEASEAKNAINLAENFSNLPAPYNRITLFDHYYLDMQETGLLNTSPMVLNGIANIQLNYIKNVVRATSVIFYYAFDFNLGELFGTQLRAIQAGLRSSVFQPLFLIGFAGSAIIILKRMLHRDLMGSYAQIVKVVLLFILSTMVVRESANVFTYATQVTSSIGASILTGGNTSTSNYAVKVSGQIWLNMMDTPWEYLEFGNDEHTEADVEDIIGRTVESPERKRIIENWTGTAFTTDYRPGERLGFLILYTIPLSAKCVLYILLGCIMLLMQLMAVFYVMLAPLVLILAMIPGYDHILSSWIRKLLESQLSILVMYFVVGLLMKVDELLYDNMAGQWGWFIVMVIQTALYIGVIIKRNELFGMFSSLGISNPIRYLNGEMSQVNGAKNYVMRKAAYAIAGATKSGLIGDGAVAKQDHQEKSTKLRNVEVKKPEPIENSNNLRKEVERPRMAAFREREAVFMYEPGEGADKGENEAQRPNMATFRERQVVFQYGDAIGGYGGYSEKLTQPVERPRMDDMYKLDDESDDLDIEPSDYRKYIARSVMEEPEEEEPDQGSLQAARYQSIKDRTVSANQGKTKAAGR